MSFTDRMANALNVVPRRQQMELLKKHIENRELRIIVLKGELKDLKNELKRMEKEDENN